MEPLNIPQNFWDQLDSDLKTTLYDQLKILWTHHSTVLEGNTLTLGETQIVMAQGLTISGKPLKDHNEVTGHGRGIDWVYNFLKKRNPLTEQDLFDVHQLIQNEIVNDIYQPTGKWKNQPNSTNIVLDNQFTINDTYALPETVPQLMEYWLKRVNSFLFESPAQTSNQALNYYVWIHSSFVRIHPFADGNGRLARLLANLVLVQQKYPPLLIPQLKRQEYITLLALWQLSLSRVKEKESLVVENEHYEKLTQFCADNWAESLALVTQALETQRLRSHV